jgi:hypothetical protein
MVVIKKILCVLSVSLFLSSCFDGIFDTLNRTTDDPLTEIPSVSSFLDSHTIHISWSEDEAADEYILERSENTISLSYQIIYRGTNTVFIDKNLPDESMFLYRLSKRRGKKTFLPSNPALGVSSLTVRDLHEPNDFEEYATHLSDITLYANMPFFRAYNGLTVSDTDWYYIEIPPLWIASIIIFDQKAASGITDTHFKIYVKDEDTPKTVSQNTPIPIVNYKTVKEKYYFKIYPRETIYTDDFSGGFGGTVADYNIFISELRPR